MATLSSATIVTFRFMARKFFCALGFGHANGQLADVFAVIQLEQRLGESLDSIHDMLAGFELAGRHPTEHFAGGPTNMPTAPAAPDTTTVSPGLGWQMSSSPKYAVMPVMPSVPRNSGSGATLGSTLVTPWPFEIAYSCTPKGA